MNVAKGLSLDGTYVDVQVAGMAAVSDPILERKRKQTVLARNAFLDEEALYTEAEKSLVIELSEQLDTSVNESAANIRWGGESKAQRNSFLESRKRSNGVDCFDIAVNGPEQLVLTESKGKVRTVRMWVSKTHNVSARIQYVNTPSHPASWLLEVYSSVKENGRWWNNKIATHYVHRSVTNESELTVAKWVCIYFARYAG